MTITELFTALGKIFGTVEALDTARGSTIPPHVQDIIDEYASLAPNYQNTISQLPNSQSSYQSQTGSFISQLYTIAGNLIVQWSIDEFPQIDQQVSTAITHLISDMLDAMDSVNACAVSAVAGSTEAASGAALFAGVLRYDAQQLVETNAENMFAETLHVVAISATNVQITGQFAVGSGSTYGWPGGSGTNNSQTIIDPSSTTNLVPNGDCETANDDDANLPDEWLVEVGTSGTTFSAEGPGESTLTVSGTPTTGCYYVVVTATNQDGNTYTTAPLPYNATAEQVQVALRALGALFANVTVSSSGTTPNFTHTITWTGVANVTLSSAPDEFDTGSVATANTVASGTVYRQGKSLSIIGNGSELTTFLVPVAAEQATQYLLALRARRVGSIGSGTLVVELINDVGTVIGSDSITLNNANLSTSWQALGVVLCTNYPVVGQTFVRLKLTTAIYAAGEIVVDDLTLARVNPLYAGGPALGVLKSRINATGDTWDVSANNDRGGKFQTHFQRAFDMNALNLQLPSKSDGSETINDSLVS